MKTYKNIKCTELEGYSSAYDYTIYDIGFIFDADDEEENYFQDNDETSNQEYIHIKPTGMGGNFH